MHSILEDLNWRYATKRYDSSKKISDEKIEIIKHALQLTPTSYGLQALKFLFIKNTDLRIQLLAHSFNQQAIVDASHLLVLCSHKQIDHSLVDSYIENTADIRSLELEKVIGFGNYIKNEIIKLTEKEQANWNKHQAYIALGILMQTCAQLRIDSTPMEGFKSEEYNQILGLEAKNLTATLVVPLGYRHKEDVNQHLKKVRRPIEELFETL